MKEFKKLTTEKWIENALLVHGNRYDYSKVVYTGTRVKVKIICKVHGEFEQTPNSHTSAGQGCPRCGGTYNYTHDEWVREKVIPVHGERRYTYLTEYKNNSTKISIKCNECGYIFNQTPNTHTDTGGHGCPKCAGKDLTHEEWVTRKVNPVHGKGRYTYLTEYDNVHTKINILCNECGHEFWQKPHIHIYTGAGCPECTLNQTQSKGASKVQSLLESYNLNYEKEKRFNDCRCKNSLPFDFYVPEFNVLIEYDGEQHTRPARFGGMSREQSEEAFEMIKLRDNIKNQYCKDNNIPLLRISHTTKEQDFNNIISTFLRGNTI